MWAIFRRSISTSGRLLCSRRMRRRVRDEEVDLTKYKKMKVFNPGVDRRLTALKDDGVTLDDVRHVDDSEADFFHIDEAYDDFKKDEAAQKELVKMKIVGQKYFDEKIPNYLTWSEKELIRELHRTDPEQWTPQKIAESFPTSPQGAKKLLKVTWKPASQSRMDRHDASAMRNWKELKEGEVEGVPPDLRRHILKFTNRTIPPQLKTYDDNNKIDISVPKKKDGEYASLITKYQTTVNKQVTGAGHTTHEGSGSQIIPSSAREHNSNKKPTTLDELRQHLSEGRGAASVVDQLILSSATETPSTDTRGLSAEEVMSEGVDKWGGTPSPSQQQAALQVNNKDNMQLAYPLRIRIPKKSLRVGATYKVKDCYYDWDGRFLYRVPGMD